MRGLFTLLFASLSTTLSGQGVVPPFQVGHVNPLPGFLASWVPVGGVLHMHLTHLPSDPPSVFYCTATVKLSNFDWDLVCGSYDVLTDTFTPNNEAAALNTSPGREIGLTPHHTWLFAVFERVFAATNLAEAWLASRPATGQPWQIAGQIAPLPLNGSRYGRDGRDGRRAPTRGPSHIRKAMRHQRIANGPIQVVAPNHRTRQQHEYSRAAA